MTFIPSALHCDYDQIANSTLIIRISNNHFSLLSINENCGKPNILNLSNHQFPSRRFSLLKLMKHIKNKVSIFSGNDTPVISATWAVARERLEKFRPEPDLNLDLCDKGAVIYQLSYQANWELAVTWVHDKPLDIRYLLYICISTYTIMQLVHEIHVFELQTETISV